MEPSRSTAMLGLWLFAEVIRGRDYRGRGYSQLDIELGIGLLNSKRTLENGRRKRRKRKKRGLGSLVTKDGFSEAGIASECGRQVVHDGSRGASAKSLCMLHYGNSPRRGNVNAGHWHGWAGAWHVVVSRSHTAGPTELRLLH